MENKAYKKEYAILCIYNKGKPFILDTFDNIYKAEIRLNELIEQQEKSHRTYFVDNDFYENKIDLGINAQKYFSILERETTQWVKSQKREKSKKKQDNILIFQNLTNI